jgi:Domain of unknown function (DUF4349)
MKIYLIGVAIASLLFACNQSSNTKNATLPDQSASQNIESQKVGTSGFVSDSTLQFWDNESEGPDKAESQSGISQTAPQPALPDWNKKIIRNAELSFEVKDSKQVTASIYEAARLSGGYIASSSEHQSDDEIRSEITIRVPREQFETLVGKISSYVSGKLQKSITSLDVSDEFVDTKARIAAREKIRDWYFDFIKQAKNTEEVLKVEDEIRELQESIESATGRINFIKHQSVLSTIHLTFFQKLSPLIKDLQPKPVTFWNLAWSSFKEGWWFIEQLTLFLVKIWPLLIIACIGGWYMRKKYRSAGISVKTKLTQP